jgi:prevent-host-death family protein
MKIAPVAEVKAQLSHFLDEAQESPVVVTRNGRPVAVITGVADADDLERLILAHTPRFRRLLDAAERRIAETGGVPHDEFWAALEKPPGSAATPRVAEKKGKYRTTKRPAR